MDISIGVAMIAGKGRLEQLKRLLPQLTSFDQVVIIQSQEDDELRKYLKTVAKPYNKLSKVEFHFEKFRSTPYKNETEMYDLNDWGFARARNTSFSYLKTTHGLWLDTDDVIGRTLQGKEVLATSDIAYNAFKKVATEASDVDVWFMDYIYSHDEAGNPNVVYARERFLKLDANWKWYYPIHEILIPGRAPKHSRVTDIQILHHPTTNSDDSGNRNMKMLKDWESQLLHYHDRNDLSRCRLLIGDTLWGQGKYEEAADHLLNVFLKNHPNAVQLERWSALVFACKALCEIGQWEKARRVAQDAIDLEPGLADGYLLLAHIKHSTGGPPRDVLHLIEQGAHVEQPPPQVVKDPLDYTYRPFVIVSEANYKLENYEAALDYALKALRIRPGDSRAENARSQAAIKLKEKDAVAAAGAMYKFLQDYDEHEKASKLFEVLPYVAQRNPTIHDLAVATKYRIKHIWNDKAFVDLYHKEDPNYVPTPDEWFDKGYIPGRDIFEYIVSRLKRHPDIKRVLHVGCLDGYHSILLSRLGYEVVGIDINKAAIDLAMERAEKGNDKVKFLHLWFERVDPQKQRDPFDDSIFERHFDAVIITEQLDKAQSPEFLIGTAADCAKPNAPIIITTPSEAFDQGDIPFTRDEDSVPKVVRAFTQESFEFLMLSNPEFYCMESHFIPYKNAYREGQGWQVGELYRAPRPNGPRIRIFVGQPINGLDPYIAESKGLGGSEIAVINMAKYWARMGCVVGIYGTSVGIYDGVLYRSHEDFVLEQHSEIFISWRVPHLFGNGRPSADVTVLWTHDLFYPMLIPDEWINHIDKIAVLSQFHKEYFKKVHTNVPEEKLWVTRNGILPQRYPAQLIKKNKNQFIYSSSPERGLEELLQLWPSLKERIPDATLHVCYGFDNALVMLKEQGDVQGYEKTLEMIRRCNELDGIKVHGRLNQTELAKLQMESEVWLYPYQDSYPEGGFLETFCISALEMQAAKVMPFCRMNGALPEVVKHHRHWQKSLTIDDIVWTINLGMPDEWLEENRSWALSQTWESLSVEWFQQLIPTKEVIDNGNRSKPIAARS